MTTFDRREQAFENKFMHDQEIQFKIISRRRKLLGLWAAKQMNMKGEEAELYALGIVSYGIDDKREGAVVNHIRDDLEKGGVQVTEEKIRDMMDELHQQASREIMEDVR
ncbi:MAG: DUF1476 domain-containing protein [Proteobacteria bacterium]|nr:DUF1476 domain-containing protein [Pseudomonadota bacterium]